LHSSITPGDRQPKEGSICQQIKIVLALALALVLGAVAPAVASARLDLNPVPTTSTPSSRPAVLIVRVSGAGGFDWGDAGIGAAATLGLSMLVIGGGVAITARRNRTPHTSSPAGRHNPHEDGTRDLSRGPDTKSTLL
jgi:hypothetical protein